MVRGDHSACSMRAGTGSRDRRVPSTHEQEPQAVRVDQNSQIHSEEDQAL